MILRSEKIFGDNMSEYQPAFTCSLYYFTEFGRDVTAYFTGQMLDVL